MCMWLPSYILRSPRPHLPWWPSIFFFSGGFLILFWFCCVSKEFLSDFDKHHRSGCYQQRHKLRSNIFSTNPGKKKNPLSSDKSWAIPNGKGIGYVLVEREKMKKKKTLNQTQPLLSTCFSEPGHFSLRNEWKKQIREHKEKRVDGQKVKLYPPPLRALEQSKALKAEVRPPSNQRTLGMKFAGSLGCYLKMAIKLSTSKRGVFPS